MKIRTSFRISYKLGKPSAAVCQLANQTSTILTGIMSA